MNQAQASIPTPPPVITDDEAFARNATRDGDTYSYSFTITKLDCNINLTIAVDGAGVAEIVTWQAEPEGAAACAQ